MASSTGAPINWRVTSRLIGVAERSLEAIVREALVPEVKTWLESNLAPLVEQIVRDEIRKMAQRNDNS